MKLKKRVTIAVAMSIMAHGAFFAVSPYVFLTGMNQAMSEARKIFRMKEVDETPRDVSLFEKTPGEIPLLKMTLRVTPLERAKFDRIFLEEKEKSDFELQRKKEKIGGALAPEPDNFSVENVLKIESEKEKKDVAPLKRPIARKFLGEETVSSVVVSDESSRKLPYVRQEDSFDVSEQNEDVWQPGSIEIFKSEDESFSSSQGPLRVGEYEDISKYLDVKLSSYTSPETGEKYFKLVIFVKKADEMKVIPKEVIFVIDSSKSITEKKLSYIKRNLVKCLENYNQGDCFNIAAFKGNLVKFKEKSVSINKETIDKIKPFIDQLEAVGQTDVENALLKIINEPQTVNPSYIVLVSDGRPTVGIVDSRGIIQQITRDNKMARPIFCFGGGLKVNRYLLEFMSYQNRAWSSFTGGFSEFYKEIKDPLLLDVSYRIKGINAAEIFPKYLSDFYMGKPFVLYGRVTDEDMFSMQLLGSAGGARKEYIFKQSFKSAVPGNADIAKEWAFRKIYYIISRNTMGLDDPVELRKEIDRLSQKYKIKTPYNIADQE
ncbi:MAG: VWA domain-containing protein [Candidatus Omnitrophota bacterium]